MKKLTTKEFIKRAKKIHKNKYDYSLVNYINNHIKVEIICKNHGSFWQKPNCHTDSKSGCPKCKKEIISKYHLKPFDKFISEANYIHQNKYKYDDSVYINTHIKIKIKCKSHGIFNQKAGFHLNGCGCPECNTSKGELEIKNILIKNCTKFIQQKTFKSCINPKTNRRLKFDFYIPSKNLLIEYDGEQHYINKKGRFHTLSDIKYKDNLKNKFCKNSGIKLLRIPYYNFKNINKILNNKVI